MALYPRAREVVMAVKHVPDGYHTVTPYLSVEGADKLIDFMKEAFGAQERMRMPGPGGVVGHAEMEFGDSVVMLADSAAADNNVKFRAMINLYVEDCDAAFKSALAAGGTAQQDPETKFYGDRNASVRDPFGNVWFISTHVEDVPADEMAKRAAEFVAQQGRS
jgi:PhnB protein